MAAVYLDYNATTPVAPEVLDAMLPFFGPEGFGNPAQPHPLGRFAHHAVERARAEVAALINAEPDEIVFTGGGTEASNLAIRGTVLPDARERVVTTAIEHPASAAPCARLEGEGHEIRRVAAGPDGVVRAADMAEAIGARAQLVTMIHAQNEIGTLQPIAEVAPAARAAGAVLHADGAQSLGKVAVDVAALGVDLLSIAGHKLYAPKGVGALYVRHGVDIRPVVLGAGQERGIRPGTPNVPYIAGLGVACRLAAARLAETAAHTKALADRLHRALAAEIPGLVLVGEDAPRLPNTLMLLFPGVSGRALLDVCPQVMASTGSACHAGSEEPSGVLTGLGVPRAQALGSVRLSLGRATTEADIDAAVRALAHAWRGLATDIPVRSGVSS